MTNKEVIKKPEQIRLFVEGSGAGVGRLVTTTTYISMILKFLEEDKYSQIAVIISTMETLDINLDDLKAYIERD